MSNQSAPSSVSSPWILGPSRDLLLFVATPLLILPVVLVALQGFQSKQIQYFVLAFGAFVYPAKFKGTCYRAANWIYLGQTTGRGKDDQTMRQNRPLKDVLGYPLTKRFRELLGRLS